MSYVKRRAEELGVPIIDAKHGIVVTVTSGDVINAKKSNSKHCAFSRAALRSPGVVAAYFFRTTAFLEYEDKIVRYKLPISAQKEIVSFDRAQIFAPGVYHLSPTAPSDAPAKRKKYNKTRRGKASSETYNERRRARTAADRAARIHIATRAADLDRNIGKIEAHEIRVAPESNEERAFKAKVAVILGSKAPTPLAPPKRMRHATQYIRTMEEPE